MCIVYAYVYVYIYIYIYIYTQYMYSCLCIDNVYIYIYIYICIHMVSPPPRKTERASMKDLVWKTRNTRTGEAKNEVRNREGKGEYKMLC